MKELDAIMKSLSARKPQLERKYNVKEIGVFGSYVRGEQKKGSDIDILVEFSKVPGLEFAGLEIELEKLLGEKVDLVRKKTLKPEIRGYILKEVVYV